MKATPPTRRRLAGFTLVELLTVIAVIGVLAAILTVTVQKALNRAARAGSASNLRQAGMLNSLYAIDHKNRYCPTESTEWGNSEFWPEYGGYQLFMEFLAKNYGSGYGVWARPRDDFKDPARPSVTRTRGPISWSYARNHGLPQKKNFVPTFPGNARVDNTVSMALLPNPSRTMLFMETNSACGLYYIHYEQIYFDSGDKTLVVYLDGHVESLTKAFMIGDDPDAPAGWVPERKLLWFGFPNATRVQAL